MPARPPLSSRWILVALATFLLPAACAHGPRSLVSPGGRLDVLNGLEEPVEVFVRGGRVAVLEPGSTAYLDRLPRQVVTVDAVGVITGEERRREIDLRDADPARWHLQATGASRAGMARQATGVVIVDNRADEPVRPFVDGEAVDLVYPGARVAFSGLALGRRTIEAVGVRTDFRTSMDVEVASGTTSVFVVAPPTAAVRVRNGADLPVRVHMARDVDEGFRDLAPGAAWVMQGLATASEVRLRADDALGRAFWYATVTPRAGIVVDVTVPAPAGKLSVLSEFDQPVTILADGRLLGTCPAQGAAEFSGLVPGNARVQAFGDDGSVLARTRMRIRAGDVPLWFLRPGTTQETGEDEGGLLVVNGTDETVRIRIDGWDRGEVARGARRQFEGLVPGTHVVEAAGASSEDVFHLRAEVAGGARLEWTVLPRNATVALRNLRDEPVRVLVDREPRIEVPAGGAVDLPVPAGMREIEAVGVRTLATTRHRIELPAAVRTTLDLARPFATVRVLNLQAQPVEISSEQGILGVVAPGQSAAFDRVPPGACRLTARSVGLPVNWNVLAWLEAGEVFDWSLGSPGAN